MGIQNLLPFLAESTRDAHINEFENEYVAIDAYCWLHKGVYSCAYNLAINKPTKQYVTYCMRYIDMLLYYKVKPILVFDGRQLLSKSETERKRREERKRKKEEGLRLLRANRVNEGQKLLGESVNITHELALNVMKECRKKNIDCIVAPYEADAQLAFLNLSKVVKCVVTEDSDLLVYGCDKVMFKMDTTGRGKLVDKNIIHLSLKMNENEYSDDIFRYMCILSGCDYLPSLPSIGPANALKFVKMLRGNDIYDALPRLPIYLNKLNIKVSSEYINGFRIADNTFKHQLVYDSFRRSQVPVRPVEKDDDIIGTKLPDDLAFQLAIGNIDPETMNKLDNFDPDESGTGFTILWRTDFLPNATPRSFPVNLYRSESTIEETRENTGLHSVLPKTTHLKKQRTPLNCKNNFSVENSIPKVPKNGFVFNVKIPNGKTNIPDVADESKLLKSRYFSREKEQKRKPQIEDVNDKRKDETYEDYLLRLYNEYFPNNDKEKEKDCSCGLQEVNLDGKKLCHLCKLCCNCCNCVNSVKVSESECIKKSDGVKKTRRKSPEPSLLDEIYKSQTETSKDNFFSSKDKTDQVSPSDSLGYNFSKIPSRFDHTSNSQTDNLNETIEEIICENQTPVTPSSPVFKLQKESKRVNNCLKFENILNTAGTSTSVYFSPSNSFPSNESTSKGISTSTPLKSATMTPSTGRRNSSNAKRKTNQLNKSESKTLFDYGFGKQ